MNVMNDRQTPILVGLVTAAVFLLRSPSLPTAPQLAGSEAASRSPGARGAQAAAASKALARSVAAAQKLRASRREYARLYRGFLGIEPPQPQPPPQSQGQGEIGTMRVRGRVAAQPVTFDVSTRPREVPVGDRDLFEIAKQADTAGYKLEFMIALVSDPIDSRLAADFDLSMSALDLALAQSGYELDRQWLPWVEPESADDKGFRETAGMMLFRHDSEGQQEKTSRLLAVFLVGESPKLGIHQQAFQRSVDFILDLRAQAETVSAAPRRKGARPSAPTPRHGTARSKTDPWLEIPVLGPSFSGSIDSLRSAIASARPRSCFWIVSGSASAPGLEERLASHGVRERVRISRTVVADDVLAAEGLRFLQDRLGWDLERVALLVESDTAFGSYFSAPHPRGPAGSRADEPPLLAKVTKLHFPSGLFALRNAWEENAGSTPPASATAGHPQQPATPRTSLEVSLADQRMPVDVVPELSPLAARLDDMAMADLLRRINRDGFSYIGILATDIKDQLFLAEQIRRWAPSVVLFVIDNNLLYVHPQYNATMFGTLTISSFPLLPERSQSAISVPAGTIIQEGRMRRQFASERQQGTYLATLNLVNHAVAHPSVWISASGHYAMWPLASLHAPESGAELWWPRKTIRLGPSPERGTKAGELVPDPPLTIDPNLAQGGPPARADLKVPLILLLLCLAGYMLRRKAVHWQDALASPTFSTRTRLLISAGAALLCLAGAFVVGLWIAGLLAGLASVEGITHWWPWLVFASLVFLEGYLVLAFLATRRVYRRSGWALAALAIAGLPLLASWTWLVFDLWRPDAGGLFYLRARAFAGGLSPLVSLAWIAAAVGIWLAVEIKRQLLLKRHDARWPLGTWSEPALAGCAAETAEVARLLRGTFPWSGRHCLAVLALVVPPLISLWARIQPIGESRCYGQLFIVFAAGAQVLALTAFIRFFAVWHRLRRVLRRIELTDLLGTLKTVAKDIGWKPTRFAWYAPSFSSLQHSAARLEGLFAPDGEPGPTQLLEDTFAAASAGDHRAELRYRERLNERFVIAPALLGMYRGVPEVDAFHAVRLIAYLRNIFNQLRYSVMAAMGCSLAVIAGVATYAFEPKEFATLVLWAELAAASAATLAVFVQMDRDATLSAIAGTDAGQISMGWPFWSNVLTYGALPLLGLLASQFPSTGRLFSSLLEPLTRILGTG
jgi:hypothetical protein